MLKKRDISSVDDTMDIVPKNLICPISYCIFNNPVCASDGFIYECADIEKWLQNSSKSPMTGELLENKTLNRCQFMKQCVNEYLEQHPHQKKYKRKELFGVNKYRKIKTYEQKIQYLLETEISDLSDFLNSVFINCDNMEVPKYVIENNIINLEEKVNTHENVLQYCSRVCEYSIILLMLEHYNKKTLCWLDKDKNTIFNNISSDLSIEEVTSLLRLAERKEFNIGIDYKNNSGATILGNLLSRGLKSMFSTSDLLNLCTKNEEQGIHFNSQDDNGNSRDDQDDNNDNF